MLSNRDITTIYLEKYREDVDLYNELLKIRGFVMQKSESAKQVYIKYPVIMRLIAKLGDEISE